MEGWWTARVKGQVFKNCYYLLWLSLRSRFSSRGRPFLAGPAQKSCLDLASVVFALLKTVSWHFRTLVGGSWLKSALQYSTQEVFSPKYSALNPVGLGALDILVLQQAVALVRSLFLNNCSLCMLIPCFFVCSSLILHSYWETKAIGVEGR